MTFQNMAIMNIHTEKNKNYFHVHIEGDLDASSCLLLDNTIASAIELGEKVLLINCEKLNYISSAGLGVFMSYIQDFENNNVNMVIYGLAEKVKNVFQILGLDELLKIVNTYEEAIQLVKI